MLKLLLLLLLLCSCTQLVTCHCTTVLYISQYCTLAHRDIIHITATCGHVNVNIARHYIVVCTSQYCHSHIQMYIVYISIYIHSLFLLLQHSCTFYYFYFIYVYVCFLFLHNLHCLGIQCGQQRKNFIVQGNLLFLTVHMTINTLNLWILWIFESFEFNFPAGLGTCPHCQKHQKLVKWPWCYCAWLASKLSWPELWVLSRGKWETRDQKMQMSWRPLSKKPGLPYHLSSATNWSPPCHAELRQ